MVNSVADSELRQTTDICGRLLDVPGGRYVAVAQAVGPGITDVAGKCFYFLIHNLIANAHCK
jgi:hypothetical protein